MTVATVDLKSEKNQKNTLAAHEQKLRQTVVNLSRYSRSIQTDIFLLKKQLREQERFLKQILNKARLRLTVKMLQGMEDNALFLKSLSIGIDEYSHH